MAPRNTRNNQSPPSGDASVPDKVFTKLFIGQLIIQVLFTGGILAFGQKWMERKWAPETAVETLKLQTTYNSKKEVFYEAISILNQMLALDTYKVAEANGYKDEDRIRGPRANELQINNCFAKLALYADDPEIPKMFKEVFGPVTVNHLPQMNRFVYLCRKELGMTGSSIDSTKDEYKYISTYMNKLPDNK